jgi:signal transduction histidine kinase
MSVETDKAASVSLALGDLLTADGPVWIWDLGARRILWANRAGQAFWRADTLDDLRGRRFDARYTTLNRVATFAAESGRTREWTERLSFAGRGDRTPVMCAMQSLQVAGGSPGLIVRVLDSLEAESPAAREAPAEAPRDKVALKAIAARLEKAQAGRRRVAAPATSRVPAEPAPADVASTQSSAAFIRELCHELRNPLTVIIGFAELIRDGEPSRTLPKVQVYAGNILEGAHLAMEILRDFSGRAGAPTFAAPEPVDVKAAVESCLRLVSPLAKQAGLTLSKSVGRHLPRLNAEDRALKQILLNVLLNAVRHQKTGGRISVTARRRRDGALRIGISDDGIGMTKKEIKAALGGKRRPPAETGALSGLGLPLVKRLVENAGGSIAIESARRKGTAVEMNFPRDSLVESA